MRKKRWLTLFPDTENVHLIKDVGMIPYILHDKLGYDSTIVSYQKGAYPYLEKEVKGLKQMFIKKVTGKPLLDGLIFILLNFKKFDILQVYHFTTQSLVWCYLFRILKLGQGRTYLKLDAKATIKNIHFSFPKSIIIDHLVNSIDLITVETKDLCLFLNQIWNRKVEYIPNGFFDDNIHKTNHYDQKENLIITVGRIGLFDKNSEILFEAAKIFIKENSSWKLEIVGPVEEHFKKYIDDFFQENTELSARIKIVGNVSNRIELENIYSRAKIFTLTSRSEGFPLVYLEAMRHGCYIVTSNVLASYDITDNEQFGKIFPIGDHRKLAEQLLLVAANDDLIKNNIPLVEKHVYKNFYWPNIGARIDQLINMNK